MSMSLEILWTIGWHWGQTLQTLDPCPLGAAIPTESVGFGAQHRSQSTSVSSLFASNEENEPQSRRCLLRGPKATKWQSEGLLISEGLLSIRPLLFALKRGGGGGKGGGENMMTLGIKSPGGNNLHCTANPCTWFPRFAFITRLQRTFDHFPVSC